MKRKELFLTSFFLILDLGSKYSMEVLLQSQTIEVIPNFFKLELTFNTGAAWSILENQLLFLILLGILSLFFLTYYKKSIRKSWVRDVAISLLYAGILGNLVDRILFHHVRDFLSFHLFSYAFPIFNLADVFIVVGTIMISIEILRGECHGNHLCNK